MTAEIQGKTNSLAELNRKFWDTNADSIFEQDWLKIFAEQLTRFLRTQAPNLGFRSRDAENPVRLLDYACARGGASWSLAPFVDEILGIDIAPAMADRFNSHASRLGYTASQAHAVAGDLTTDDSLAAPASFDVVIISLALHHLDDPPAMLGRLAERLKPGGVLVAVEGIDTDEKPAGAVAELAVTYAAHGDIHHRGHSHDHGHSHTHKNIEGEVLETTNQHIYDEATFRKWFGDARCDDKFVYIVNDEVSHIPASASNVPGGLNRKMVIAAAMKR
ncbi:hypothetical protein CkaCkLH20_12097 [Colletotrichum karsti]|uniref:Methyltransferase type 12 domain-containing protein n=1 Tax=Colletotrichum karsti TaxID=1095194 RepID=A0A9P6I1Y6_9PEZI|nr:uncharacterized protein CkaCkLH20_12097 [Colletotrichum karsti]KAF9870430.1 hypothetical protein CkaCkLH20_12097 [Colletotrichum karsti]